MLAPSPCTADEPNPKIKSREKEWLWSWPMVKGSWGGLINSPLGIGVAAGVVVKGGGVTLLFRPAHKADQA